MNELLPWAGPAIALAGFVYMVYMNRKKASTEALQAIDAKVAEKAERDTVALHTATIDILKDRVTRIETDFKHLPDKDATHSLQVAISEMRGEVKQLRESIRPVAAMADRIQEAMIDQVKFK